MALTITNNSPGAGSVAWAGLIVKLKGVDYTVTDGNSSKKYLWWDLSNPSTMQESDTTPTLTIDDCIVIINVSGTAYWIPDSTLIHGDQIIAGTIPQTALSSDPHPSGFVHDWAGTIASIPSGWLFCNGASLERAAYPDLFSAIGTIHGSVDSSHFNIPDYRDFFLAGAKQDDSSVPKTNISGSLTTTGGAATVTLDETMIPAHTHTYTGHNRDAAESPDNGGPIDVIGNAADPTWNTGSTGGGLAHNNLPPYKVIVKIIKT